LRAHAHLSPRPQPPRAVRWVGKRLSGSLKPVVMGCRRCKARTSGNAARATQSRAGGATALEGSSQKNADGTNSAQGAAASGEGAARACRAHRCAHPARLHAQRTRSVSHPRPA
jgi:hypothetical protein